MEYFYCENIELYQDIQLSEEESKHLCLVLRKKVGDAVLVINGHGSRYFASIKVIHPKASIVQLNEVETEERHNPIEITLAVSLTKSSDRFEWFVEKAVELGVSKIIPMTTERTLKTKLSEQRLEKILLAALKQSGRVWKPFLAPVTSFNEVIESSKETSKFIAFCEGDNRGNLFQSSIRGSSILLIGPEGDFSEKEVSKSIKFGYQPISLGKTRLRVETAALLGLTLLNLQYDVYK